MNLKNKIQRLRIGKSFRVENGNDRKEALKIASILGIILATRESKRGGFTVTRLPE